MFLATPQINLAVLLVEMLASRILMAQLPRESIFILQMASPMWTQTKDVVAIGKGNSIPSSVMLTGLMFAKSDRKPVLPKVT